MNGLKDLLSVHLNFLVAKPGNAPQFLKVRWLYQAQILQRGIVQDHERREAIILRRVPPPFAQKLVQLSIDRRFSNGARYSRLRRTFRLRHPWLGTASLALLRLNFQPVGRVPAGVADSATIPPRR